MPRPFETYFGNRPALSGPQPATGDEALVLRSGTVYRALTVNNNAMMYMAANATATALAVVDAWTAIGGTLLVPAVNPAVFTFAANQLTYIGPSQEYPAKIRARASIVGDGVVTDVEIGVFANAVLVQNGMRATVPNAEYAYVECECLHPLTVGDVLDMRVRSRGGTGSVTLSDVQFVVT